MPPFSVVKSNRLAELIGAEVDGRNFVCFRWSNVISISACAGGCVVITTWDWDDMLWGISWCGCVVCFVCWSLTSLCHSNGHIETMPAREINPFTALTRIRSQFLRTQ